MTAGAFDRTPDTTERDRSPRLTAERIIDGAVELADQIGTDALTIRKLAARLDVKPMTIYHHVPSKDAILDGMVDRVFAEIELPPTDQPWRDAIRASWSWGNRTPDGLGASYLVGVLRPWSAPVFERPLLTVSDRSRPVFPALSPPRPPFPALLRVEDPHRESLEFRC